MINLSKFEQVFHESLVMLLWNKSSTLSMFYVKWVGMQSTYWAFLDYKSVPIAAMSHINFSFDC